MYGLIKTIRISCNSASRLNQLGSKRGKVKEYGSVCKETSDNKSSNRKTRKICECELEDGTKVKIPCDWIHKGFI